MRPGVGIALMLGTLTLGFICGDTSVEVPKEPRFKTDWEIYDSLCRMEPGATPGSHLYAIPFSIYREDRDLQIPIREKNKTSQKEDPLPLTWPASVNHSYKRECRAQRMNRFVEGLVSGLPQRPKRQLSAQEFQKDLEQTFPFPGICCSIPSPQP
jgi:hypothetical protein